MKFSAISRQLLAAERDCSANSYSYIIRHPSLPLESSLHFQVARFWFVIVNTRYYAPAKASTSAALKRLEVEALAGAWSPKSFVGCILCTVQGTRRSRLCMECTLPSLDC